MFKKISRNIFITVFLAMLVIPLVTVNRKEGKVSETENRKLAPMARLYSGDGTLNKGFLADFETWLNDNIGFRSAFVSANAGIRYYLFGVLPDNSDMYLGPEGELNYATDKMLKDYQHANLYSEEYLRETADCLQCLCDYAESKGAQFYYYQCWDKHSIYPEHFPDTVLQTGSESKTDGIVRAFEEYTDVNVISPKQDLLDAKSQYNTYSMWGDPAHWTERGAYIGYRKLMNAINANSADSYRVLEESDYTISVTDQGKTLSGGIHNEDLEETFQIKEPRAVLMKEKLTLYAEDGRHRFFTNEAAGNKTRLLVIGDSYFNSFIMEDLAESFYETVIIWGDYLGDIKNIIDAYDADIVVVEAAERVDRTWGIRRGAEAIKKAEAAAS